MAATRQLGAAVEHADVVQPEETALEDVVALAVLAVHPPREVQEQLVEDALQEGAVRRPAEPPIDLEDAPRRPGMDRRVDVGEVPLVGRQLPVWVHEPLARQQHELVLREVGVDEGERDRVEREVPGGEPWVLPRIGHRDDVGAIQLAPVGVAAGLALDRRRRAGRIAVEPPSDVVAVELLAPDQARESSTLDHRLVGRQGRRRHGREERVRLGAARDEDVGRILGRRRCCGVGAESEDGRPAFAWLQDPASVEGRLRDARRRVGDETAPVAVDDREMEGVLDGRGS